MLAVTCGLLALLGHMWPVTIGFRGGKGVATIGGIVFALNWMAALIALGVWVVVVLASRYVSLGSVVGAVALPAAHHFTRQHFEPRAKGQWVVTVFLAIAAALVVLRHRANLGRLLDGTEKKLGRKEPAA